MLHQGIVSSSFRQSFNLADHVKVVGANLEHGLLTAHVQLSDLDRAPSVAALTTSSWMTNASD
jgi:HSP20 family molecular chaperone IbpA